MCNHSENGGYKLKGDRYSQKHPYSLTVKRDGPAAVRPIMATKMVERIEAAHRNILFLKKNSTTDKTGIRIKITVLMRFKSNKIGRYQFIIIPLMLKS